MLDRSFYSLFGKNKIIKTYAILLLVIVFAVVVGYYGYQMYRNDFVTREGATGATPKAGKSAKNASQGKIGDTTSGTVVGSAPKTATSILTETTKKDLLKNTQKHTLNTDFLQRGGENIYLVPTIKEWHKMYFNPENTDNKQLLIPLTKLDIHGNDIPEPQGTVVFSANTKTPSQVDDYVDSANMGSSVRSPIASTGWLKHCQEKQGADKTKENFTNMMSSVLGDSVKEGFGFNDSDDFKAFLGIDPKSLAPKLRDEFEDTKGPNPPVAFVPTGESTPYADLITGKFDLAQNYWDQKRKFYLEKKKQLEKVKSWLVSVKENREQQKQKMEKDLSDLELKCGVVRRKQDKLKNFNMMLENDIVLFVIDKTQDQQYYKDNSSTLSVASAKGVLTLKLNSLKLVESGENNYFYIEDDDKSEIVKVKVARRGLGEKRYNERTKELFLELPTKYKHASDTKISVIQRVAIKGYQTIQVLKSRVNPKFADKIELYFNKKLLEDRFLVSEYNLMPNSILTQIAKDKDIVYTVPKKRTYVTPELKEKQAPYTQIKEKNLKTYAKKYEDAS